LDAVHGHIKCLEKWKKNARSTAPSYSSAASVLLQLLKIGGRIIETASRIRVPLALSHPATVNEWMQVNTSPPR
jgi:hypothetical protein